jgi:ADP-heptose:LPS heptosyltransferase/predicted SAM-dependent methyltransferase
MVWRVTDPQGDEAAKIRWEIVPYTRGLVLDLGSGSQKAFPHFIGVDNGHHQAAFGIPVRPDVYLPTVERLNVFATESVDAVFSSHCLEHIEDYRKALREWWRVIKVGGHLVLYLPHKAFYPNIGQKGANPDHKHDFAPEDIVSAMMEAADGWDLVRNEERNLGREYSFFQVYKKLPTKRTRLFSARSPRPQKTAGVIRYGAFGDLLIASSVLAGLKAQGFHTTLYSSPPGSDVVLHDPNIDRIYMQDKDQVPNGNLGEFWANEKPKYDRWVNLSESIEGSFLAMHDRIQTQWPKAVRHQFMNYNYLEFAHSVAQVPHVPHVMFYETEDERQWVRYMRRKMGHGEVIVWATAGSSVHKTWAGMDTIIARILLTYRDAKVVLVGGNDCVILQAGWENEQRVLKTCGKWSIRESLAFAKLAADLVIGPETGLLNSVSCIPSIAKICLLSHSSHENLTRDWVNTQAIAPDVKQVDCYPCHMLHYTWTNCRKHEESGTAMCQWSIEADTVWDAVKAAFANREREAA